MPGLPRRLPCPAAVLERESHEGLDNSARWVLLITGPLVPSDDLHEHVGAGGSRLGKLVQDPGNPFQRGGVVVGPRASLRDDRDP